MTGWSVLVYLSAGVVYFAVVATLWGLWVSLRHTKARDLD